MTTVRQALPAVRVSRAARGLAPCGEERSPVERALVVGRGGWIVGTTAPLSLDAPASSQQETDGEPAPRFVGARTGGVFGHRVRSSMPSDGADYDRYLAVVEEAARRRRVRSLAARIGQLSKR